MSTKNLLIINQYACAPKYRAGVGERHFYLAKYFNNAGYNTTIVGSSYNHLIRDYPNVNGIVTDECIDEVDFKWIKIKPYKKGNAFGRVWTWFEFLFKLFFLRFKKPPDIVIISTMSLLPLIYGVFLKNRYGVKLIHEVRDIWPLTAIELGPYSKNNPLVLILAFIEKIGFKRADAIVSVLAGFQEYLQIRFGKMAAIFRWIPNGIEGDSVIRSIPQDIRQQIPANKFLVVYTGSLGKANAMHFFVESAKLLKDKPNIHFLIVGNGDERSNLIDMADGAANITFITKVDKPIVLSIIALSDVCYIGWNKRNIYKYGVSANKYNDYMLMKKPILTSINSKYDPVHYANCGLVVEAENTLEIANGLCKLYELDAQKRNELGKNGFNYLTKNNVLRVLADKYIDLFKELNLKNV